MFSDQPHARMASIDTGEAEAVQGVGLILTAKDVPVNEYGLTVFDQPVLVGLGSDMPNSDISLWEGDQIAVIVAETLEAAEKALQLIKIEWEELPVISDPVAAMQDDTILHPKHGTNIRDHFKIRKGDMDAGWAMADVIVEDTYRVPNQEHAFLQPEAAVGYIDEEGRITVEIAGQWTHEDQEQIAHALDIPPEQIRVKYTAIGGVFGGREDMSLQIVLALAAKRLYEMGINRPVRTIWSRKKASLAIIRDTRVSSTPNGERRRMVCSRPSKQSSFLMPAPTITLATKF